MPRPVMHPPDAFVDAAVTLFGRGGARAITMAATARLCGAPSGSLYHQFPDRPALLASLWLRTVSRFHEQILVLAARDDAGTEVAVACARHVVTWSAHHLAEARVLVAGRETFEPALWSEAAHRDLHRVDARSTAALRGVIDTAAARSGTDRHLVRLAVVDLPYAAVRPFLLQGRPVPRQVEKTVTTAVRRLLA